MFHMGTPELLILLVIVVLIFGVGRISKIAGEMGKGVKEFQKGLKEQGEVETKENKG